MKTSPFVKDRQPRCGTSASVFHTYVFRPCLHGETKSCFGNYTHGLSEIQLGWPPAYVVTVTSCHCRASPCAGGSLTWLLAPGLLLEGGHVIEMCP